MNGLIKKICVMMMLITVSFTMPVMAEDNSAHTGTGVAEAANEVCDDAELKDETAGMNNPVEFPGEEEVKKEDAEDSDDNGVAEAAPEDSDDNGVSESAPEDDSVTDSLIDTDEEDELSQANLWHGAKFYAAGGPELVLTENGPEYHTGGRYELVSITADRDAGEFAAGKEIPEEIIPDIEFSEGTVVTYTFEPSEKDDTEISHSPSETAIYDGVWDETIDSIT